MVLSDLPIASITEDGKITVLRHVFFKCTLCGDCCRLNNIPATDRDMVRMLDAGIPVDQIVEELSPVLIASKNLEKGFVKAYLLRRKPFVNECAFLGEDGLCKVHLIKPIACQLYPFSVRRAENGYIATIHPKNVCRFIELDVEENRSTTKVIVEELLAKLFEEIDTTE